MLQKRYKESKNADKKDEMKKNAEKKEKKVEWAQLILNIGVEY